MVQLLLILCGSRVVRRNWWLVFFFGVFWMAIGAVVFSNALFSQSRISPIWFTVPLLIDGILSLATAFAVGGTARSLRLSKAGMLLCVALFIIFTPRYSGIIIGILVGLFLMIDAAWRAGSNVLKTWVSGSATHRRNTSAPGLDKTRARAASMAWSMASGTGTAAAASMCWRDCMSAIRWVVSGWLRR